MKGFLQRIFGGGQSKREISPEDLQRLQPFMEAVEELRLPYAGLVPDLERQLADPAASRLGGQPFWPEGQDYPQSRKGRPKVFLAQINFSEMPALEYFPQQGLMQVYVDDDSLLGCRFPSRANEGFSIHYWPQDSLSAAPRRVGYPAPKFSPFAVELGPEGQGIALSFEIGSMRPSFADWRIDAPDSDNLGKNSERLVDYFIDSLEEDRAHVCFVGGHAQFIQYDIRSDQKFADYDTVLLQLGSDELMMWGDMGEATFLIRSSDLARQDFSDCLYHSDCY